MISIGSPAFPYAGSDIDNDSGVAGRSISEALDTLAGIGVNNLQSSYLLGNTIVTAGNRDIVFEVTDNSVGAGGDFVVRDPLNPLSYFRCYSTPAGMSFETDALDQITMRADNTISINAGGDLWLTWSGELGMQQGAIEYIRQWTGTGLIFHHEIVDPDFTWVAPSKHVIWVNEATNEVHFKYRKADTTIVDVIIS